MGPRGGPGAGEEATPGLAPGTARAGQGVLRGRRKEGAGEGDAGTAGLPLFGAETEKGKE